MEQRPVAIIRTGKHFDPATTERLMKLHLEARNMPVIVVTQRRLGPEAKDEATLAMERFHDELNRCAVAAGMPEPRTFEGDVVNYGCDYSNGEILDWEPDQE
jgi:hypothetical protein